MDDKKEKKQELRSFEWKETPSAPEIYANYLHVGWSLDDIRIFFGTLTAENVNSKNFYAEEKGSAILGWRQAKGLRDMLIRIVADYEEKNGEITVPLMPDLSSRDEKKEKKVQ